MVSSIEAAKAHKRFEGFRNTPYLWEGLLEGLTIYTTNALAITTFPQINQTGHIRLGKLTEQFMLFELEQDPSVELLVSNLQVFDQKTTIGELDCLMKESGVHKHLEFVYKFYLYYPSIPAELNRWVGPNQNDSLVQKLAKLKERQMPLLYHSETKKLLRQYHLNPIDFQQKVCFRAQLFVPLNFQKAELLYINNDCIQGVYLRYEELKGHESYGFYIHAKLDWLMEPHDEVDWLEIGVFRPLASEQLNYQRSRLCWMRSAEGVLSMFFLVWW